MTWTFDDSSASGTMGVPAASMRNYYDWRRRVRDLGEHPYEAARYVGDLAYKQLRGSNSQYEIRLSQKHRATFTVDDDARRVTVHQIGGHT